MCRDAIIEEVWIFYLYQYYFYGCYCDCNYILFYLKIFELAASVLGPLLFNIYLNDLFFLVDYME